MQDYILIKKDTLLRVANEARRLGGTENDLSTEQMLEIFSMVEGGDSVGIPTVSLYTLGFEPQEVDAPMQYKDIDEDTYQSLYNAMSAGFVTLFGSVLHQDTEIMFMVGLTCLGTIMGDEKKPHFLQGTYTENGVVYTLDLNTNNPVNPTAYNIGFSARNEKPSITVGEVELLAANWTGSNNLHSQVVSIDGVTENSRIDLTPSVEQLAVFYDKDLAFVTENEDGIVTVYAIGQRPENDYTIQVTITEVRV